MSAAEVLEASAPPGRSSASPLGLLRFLGSELRIVFGRRRNIAGLAVLAVVPIVLAIAVRLSEPSGGDGPPFIGAITGNGLFVAFAALAAELPVFLPLAVAVIAGDSVAGEANIGTLRYLLTIPAGRTRLLADFHVVLARMAGNDVLVQMLVDLLSRCSLIALMYQSSHSAEHSRD